MRFGRAENKPGKVLGYYDWGATPFYALATEPRLSYCLYVPRDYEEDGTRHYPLVVVVHGTERGAQLYRDLFADFAETRGVIVLAPLFPCNLAGPGDTENYKWLEAGGIRFDLRLLDMVSEATDRYRIAEGGMLIHGFSGGGHFVHRLLYLHPDRIRAASIGAPGVVTLFDDTVEWPVGTRGMELYFGKHIDKPLVARVPVQCVVGADDTETWEITVPRDAPIWRPGMNETGRTRIDRLRRLAATLEAGGASVRFDLVEGVAHDGRGVLPQVMDFFDDILAGRGRP